MELYTLVAPYVLAKMLVAAPWHPVGAWLLVLLGMAGVLGGVYVVYASRSQQRTRSLTYVLTGVSLVGFGISANAPLAAAGALWVLLAGLLWLTLPGWRWAEVAALVALLPGLWMISQASLDSRYGVVVALLVPSVLLSAFLITHYASAVGRPQRWIAAIPFGLALIAVAMPQFVAETILRPAVTTMAGGVGALTTLGINWGVGMLARTAQGTIAAALPATGLALAVFLAAVVLYWLKQLAGRATRQADGDAQAE
jgi:MFS family permease